MKNYKFIMLCTMINVFSSCTGQSLDSKPDQIVGGTCEGCEAIVEFGEKKLSAIDTLPGFEENEPKLKISGKVFQEDGETPVSDVIIYIYQTNRIGIYETKGDETGWAKRHGIIRGWVKTGKEGNYSFYTFRPGAYPTRDEPEHIHITVKEQGKTAYYLDEFVFVDDPLLSQEKRKNLPNRGGSGITNPILGNGIWTIRRDLILGKNIPDYE